MSPHREMDDPLGLSLESVVVEALLSGTRYDFAVTVSVKLVVVF